MEKIDIILWVMGAGFSMIFGLILVMWNNLTHTVEKLDEKITDIDRRLCRLEGAFTSKDCCVLKQDHNLKKAE